jgi:hypothetical protein
LNYPAQKARGLQAASTSKTLRTLKRRKRRAPPLPSELRFCFGDWVDISGVLSGRLEAALYVRQDA